MPTAPRPTVFVLENGSTLVVAAGTRWETCGIPGANQAVDAESRLEYLQEHIDALREIVNQMRALHGQDPIKRR